MDLDDNSGDHKLRARTNPVQTSNSSQRTTPVQTGKRKAREFLNDMAIQTPIKSRRLVIATEMAVLERAREKVLTRIRKNQERAHDLMARIEVDEVEKARLD